MFIFPLKFPIRLVALTSLALLIISALTSRPTHAQEEGDYILYLLLMGVSEANTQPPPPPPPVEGDLFIDTQYKTSSAGIQVDTQGGMHLVYYYYEAAGNGRPTYGVYLYCPGDCEENANWNGVAMGELVNEIVLQLTSSGQPRIIYRTSSQVRPNGNDYYYAACNDDCTNPTQWGLMYLTSSSGISVIDLGRDDSMPQRYFALDPNGRPRFVYSDGIYGHLGTYYAYCDGNCLDPEDWYETKINKDNGNQGPYRDEDFYYPALTFTSQGQPRILSDGVSLQDETFLFYLTCDNNCNLPESWHNVPLWERGSGMNVSYDLELNAQNQPRIAFYEGAKLNGEGDRLYYAWCNSACLNGNNWFGSNLGLAHSEGRGPDLELDAAGHPRLAYALYSEGGLGYSWCNNNCESANANWQHQAKETASYLYNVWPVAYPTHCDGGLWDGVAPSLALDSAGNPRIAYDTTYHARCWYNYDTGEWEPWSVMHLIQRAVRVVYFPQP